MQTTGSARVSQGGQAAGPRLSRVLRVSPAGLVAFAFIALGAALVLAALASPSSAAAVVSVTEGGSATLDSTVAATNDPSYLLATGPAHGSLVAGTRVLSAGDTFTAEELAGGTIRYVHAGGEDPGDGFRLEGASGSSDVALAVQAVNDAPRLAGLSLSTSEDYEVTAQLTVTDPDSGAPSYSIVGATLRGRAGIVGDVLRFVPSANVHGSDSVTVRATDSEGAYDERVIPITILAVNDIPRGVDDRFHTRPGQPIVRDAALGVLSNDWDVERNSLFALLVYEPAHGNLTFKQDGSFVYVPDPGFIGDDQFIYRVRDGDPQPDWNLVKLIVRSNVPPQVTIAVPDATPIGTPLAFSDKSRDVDGTIANWTWRFGDGGIAYGPAVQHTYEDPGLHVVQLTVRDAEGGTSTVERRLTVVRTDAAPPPTLSNAGRDLITATGALVELEAGTALDHLWVQVGGEPVDLPSTTEQILRFTAPENEARLIFELVAFDGWTVAAPDRVEVRVLAADNFPKAIAGPDLHVEAGELVRMFARADGYPDEANPYAVWRQVGGDPVHVTPLGRAAEFRAPSYPTTIRFVVHLDDGHLQSLPDELEVVVRGASGTFQHGAAKDLGARAFWFEAEGAGTRHWDFGDGTNATGAAVNHTYDEPGTYLVRLEATMPDGVNWTATERITVRADRRTDGSAQDTPAVALPLLAAALVAVAFAARRR